MRLTVLGKSPAWQDAGGACSGYLIEDEVGGVRTALVLDCGPGVFGKLRLHRDYVDVTAVAISHLHADHVLDLVPFASALTYAPRQRPATVPLGPGPGTDRPARPALHAPPGAREAFSLICSGAAMGPGHIEAAFALREYDPAETLEVGSLRLRFVPVPHFIPTQAVEVRSEGSGRRLTFSADSAPSDALVDFARGTDLLLIEATLRRAEPEGPRGHLTPAEAGEHGRRAGAARLVLTHISDELDAASAQAEATEAFGGEVVVASDGAVFDLQ